MYLSYRQKRIQKACNIPIEMNQFYKKDVPKIVHYSYREDKGQKK